MSNQNPKQVEDDWIANFFDECRLISDEEMQKLWAKVLAGEANSPGRFSKRTVDLLGSLDKSDATLFTKLCGFNFQLGFLWPLIYEENDKIYLDQGINFGSLSHLETTGLVHFREIGTYVRTGLLCAGVAHYFDELVYIKFPNPDACNLPTGKVMLTVAGRQLAPLCGAQPVDGFAEYVRQQWKNLGYITEQLPEEPTAQDVLGGPLRTR